MDHPYLLIDKPKIFATEAGLSGERAESSWRKRMAKLLELGFIQASEGASGPFHHVVLLNPHVGVTRLNHKGRVQKATWDFFKERAEEVGARIEIKEAEMEIREEEKAASKAKSKVRSPTTSEGAKPIGVKKATIKNVKVATNKK